MCIQTHAQTHAHLHKRTHARMNELKQTRTHAGGRRCGRCYTGARCLRIIWPAHNPFLCYTPELQGGMCPFVYGCVFGGFQTTRKIQVYDVSDAQAESCAGSFYGGNGVSLAASFVFALLIIVWVGCSCKAVFGVLGHFYLLRVEASVEEVT